MGSYYQKYISNRDPIDDCYDWPITGVPGTQLREDGFINPVTGDYVDERWKRTEYCNIWVSNYGRFFDTDKDEFVEERSDRHGHLHLNINDSPPYHQPSSHRIVATMFIDNPEEYEIVRHLDDDPVHNTVDNLAWGTRKDNYQDSVDNGRAYLIQKDDWLKSNEITRHPILAINLATGEELYFKSQTEAGRVLGIPQANIWKVIKGQRPRAGGYIFREISREDELRYK